MIIFIAQFVICAQSADAGMDAARFSRIIGGLHGAMRDLSLVFEGDIQFVGPDDLPGPKPGKDRYQGNYVFRNDGATLLDFYQRGDSGEALLIHAKRALLRGDLEELDVVPDTKNHSNIIKGAGSPGSLSMPGSPHRIIYYWFFQDNPELHSLNFENNGWEQVDGHRCLKVKVDRYPGRAERNKDVLRLWIDMDRGGHPLKVEMYRGTNLVRRTHTVQLDRFDLPGGGDVWLPVSGITDSFLWRGKYLGEPTFRETYYVVKGSVRLNQSLTDRVFTVSSRGGLPGSSVSNPLRREFDEAASHRAASRKRTDPAGVQAELDRQLAEADRQARMIEASSVARETWGWSTSLAMALVVLGIALVCGVAIARRMHR